MHKKLPSIALAVLAIMLVMSLVGCFANQTIITFDTMGGKAVSSIGIDANTKVLDLPTPERDGYKFEYWCYDIECTQRVDINVIPEEDTTFYAKWERNLIAVAFRSINPLTNKVTTEQKYYQYGQDLSEIELPAVPQVDGYDGRWLVDNIYTIIQPITIEAVYTQRQITVSYFVGDQLHANFSGVENTTIALPQAPIKQGYSFVGWYLDSEFSTPTQNLPTQIPSSAKVFYARFIASAESDYFSYVYVGNKIKIVGLTEKGKRQSEINIPRVINDSIVTSIGYQNNSASAPSLAVFDSTNLQTVLIPSTIELIGDFAFYGATSLKEVIFDGSGLVTLGTGSFASCTSLTNLSLPNSLQSIGKYCFAGMKIGNGNNHISFDNQASWSSLDTWIKSDMALTNISFAQASNLKTIGDFAFFNLTNFEYIKLPSALESFSYLAFVDSNLTNIEAYPNGNFDTYLGAVYTNNGTTLVYYPIKGDSSYTLRETTTTIANNAFFGNKNITSVTANDGLKNIGQYAFFDCSNLSTFNIPTNSTLQTISSFAFAKSKVGSFAVPQSLTSVGIGAFKDATNLATFDFGTSGITTVAEQAFYNCTSLSGINIPSTVKYINSEAFFGCINMSSLTFGNNSQLEKIDSYAFTDCININLVTLPSGLKIINQYAFAGVSGKMNLELSSIPSQLTHLGDYAFSNTRLASFNLNVTLQQLGEGVFANCEELYQFTFSSSSIYITTVPENMFLNCVRLSTIKLQPYIKTIEKFAFQNCIRLTKIEYINEEIGVESIGQSAFENCIALKSDARILHKTLTFLGERAFYGCVAIETVVIPQGLTVVEKQSFAHCSSLKNINYDGTPSLHTIKEEAFAHCTAIETARLPASLDLRDGQSGAVKNPFIGCSSLTAFSFSAGSSLLSIISGVVYYQNGTTKMVYLYPTGKNEDFMVDKVTTDIDSYAFYGSAVKKVTFENYAPIGGVEQINLISIGKFAFAYSNIEEINLSKRVYLVDSGAFAYSSLAMLTISTDYIDSTNGSYAINNLDIDNNQLTIKDSAFIATKISSLTLPQRVVDIQNSAFAQCYSLISITFTNSELFDLQIGDYAFFGDSSLISIDLPQQLSFVGSYAFSNCYNLQEVSFNYLESLYNNITIGDYAFSNNHYLYQISLPSHLTGLGEGVFSYNSKLTAVTFAPTIVAPSLEIPKLAFYSSFAIKNMQLPDYISKIGEKAFWKTQLESIELGGIDLVIGSYAFAEMPLLSTIHLPQSLSIIGEYAFYNTPLNSFSYSTVGNDIQILSYAFYGTALKNIDLNDRFVLIDSYAFAQTQSLSTAILPQSIVEIGSHAFEHSSLASITLTSATVNVGDYTFAHTKNLQGITNCFTTIGDYAFYASNIAYYQCNQTLPTLTIGEGSFAKCDNLTAVSLQASGNISIDNFAFAQSINLQSLSISGNFVTIGSGISYGASALTQLQILDSSNKYITENNVLYALDNLDRQLLQYPAGLDGASFMLAQNVTSICDYAFYGNNYLLSLVVMSNSLLTVGTNSFVSTNKNLKIYVPQDNVEDYKQAWGDGFNINFITQNLDGLVLKYLGNGRYSIIDYVNTDQNIVISGTISANGQTYNIVQIEEYAFANNTIIEQVTVGSGINSIFSRAFANCTNLQQIIIGDSVTEIKDYAFANCTALSNISFGKNITTIGNYAFANCVSLTSIVLPNKLEAIGNYTFSNASAVNSITFGDKLVSIGSNAFEHNNSLVSIVLPASLKTIGSYIFSHSYKLNFVYLSSILPPKLSDKAFLNTSKSIFFFVNNLSLDAYKTNSDWRNFSSKIIATSNISNVESYENYVIEKISGTNYRLVAYLGQQPIIDIVSSVTPQINITEISGYAITNFAQTVTLHEGILIIDDYAFYNATNLQQISLPNSLTKIGKYSFSNLKLLHSVVIDSSSNLNTIDDYAFYNTTAMLQFAFPKKVKSIGSYAFAKEDTSALANISFLSEDANLKLAIANYAFAHNYLLKTITFNIIVASLGDGAFSGCTNLDAMYFNTLSGGENVTKIDRDANNVFKNCNKLSVFVRTSNLVNAFQGAWNNSYDRDKVMLNSMIAKDIEGSEGQAGFVIAPQGTNTATIINYIGTDTVVTFPSHIKIDNNDYIITKIGRSNGAVISSSVTKVVIPNSVNEISNDAFRNSLSLKEVVFENNSLLTTIGTYAFANCTKLESIIIPDGILNIANYAFANCSSLTSVVFKQPINTEKSLTIKEYAFYNCAVLGTVELPNHVLEIQHSAFRSNPLLTNIIIDNNASKLQTIAEYAFAETAITAFELPYSVTTVKNYAFDNCKDLRYIYINRETGSGTTSLTSAQENVFGNNSSPFIKIYAPTNSYTSYETAIGWNKKTVVPNLRQGDFSYIAHTGNTVTLTNYWGNSDILQIPSFLVIGGVEHRVTTISSYFGNENIKQVVFSAQNHVTALQQYAFAQSTALQKIHLPKDIVSIGRYAFYNCTALFDIVLPQNLTGLNERVFANCSSLQEIKIPASVQFINEYVFTSCTKLNKLIFDFSGTIVFNNTALSSTPSTLKIVVADNMVEYFVSEWTAYSAQIVGKSSVLGDFVVEKNATGYTLLQYSGKSDIDLTTLTFFGLKINALAQNSIIDDSVTITVDGDTVIYTEIADRVIVVE